MGHVPSSETRDIPIATFPAALAESESHTGGYDRARWIYVPDSYREFRYLLGTRGRRPLVCIGINPSTAAPDDLDNTLKSVARIAAANRFDSWLMLNAYAQRATRPDDLDRACNPALHAENLAALRWVLARSEPGTALWAAWGAVVEKRGYLKDCVRDMAAAGRAFGARWVCAGRCSKDGHPHHPLYLRRDEPVRDFDIAAYLDALDLRRKEAR